MSYVPICWTRLFDTGLVKKVRQLGLAGTLLIGNKLEGVDSKDLTPRAFLALESGSQEHRFRGLTNGMPLRLALAQ